MDRQRSKPLLCKTVYCSNSVIIENRENLTTDFTVVLKSHEFVRSNDREGLHENLQGSLLNCRDNPQRVFD